MDLFSNEIAVDGLQYIPDFITEEEETTLINLIDNQIWLNDLKRRVQHYGWKYDYQARKISEDLRIGKLPDWLEIYSQKLKNIFEATPSQVIINEYKPSQGISPHIDIPAFGETIASLSLGSSCMMEFSQASQKEMLWLEPRSLIVLKGDARYKWKHSIPARKNDKHRGILVKRSRRISLTFRTILP